MKRILLIFLFLISAGCAHLPKGERPAHQTLVIALDGVPYHLVDELKREGHFADFQSPAKVIAPFPSTTTCGFGAIFHPIGGDIPPGYDREYYSRERKRVVSFMESLHTKSRTDFHNLFDYARRSPFKKFWIYATPSASARRDLVKIRKLVWSSPAQTDYLTYIGGTDGAGHVLGGKRVKHWLIYMEAYLRRMREDYRQSFHRDLDVVLFSDHGFHYIRKPNAVSKNDIVHRLRRIGLTYSNNLKKTSHVVAIEWGNISGANFYADPAYVPKIAEILGATKGVAIVAYPWEGTIRVISYRHPEREYAEVACDAERKKCRYRPLMGDPLHYAQALAHLRERGRLDGEGFANSEDWFQETKDLEFPDALYRLHHAFNNLVQNTASILLSTEPNYEYGDVMTRVGAWMHGGLKGTHGGLFQEASDAFAMSTDARLSSSSALRYDQVMEKILDRAGVDEILKRAQVR